MLTECVIQSCFLLQEQSPGDPKDFAILRFHAGPPYEVYHVIIY